MGCENKLTVHTNHVIQTTIIQKDGWLQYFELIPYQNGFVIQLTDYFGGEGEKPTEYIGWYMGADGWVEDIADAFVIAEKGSQVEMRLGATHIQWKYDTDTVWMDLISISALQMPALEAAEVAIIAANNADEKAQLAVVATDNANNAANSANASAQNADEKATLAETATTNANNATTAANTATTNANNAATSANTATSDAINATNAANTAAQSANAAATNANDAADVARTSWQYVNYLFGYSDELGAILEYAYLNNFKAPSTPYLQKLDNHISDLKTHGLFAKMDLAYWMVGDGDMNFKCINIVNPALSGTPMGGLINTLQGIEGNGVDGYISNPLLADMLLYTLNSAGRASWVYKEHNNTQGYIDRGGANNWIRNNNSVSRINGGNISVSLVGTGYKALNRISASEVTAINNESEGTQINNSTSYGTDRINCLDTLSLVGLSYYSQGAPIVGQDAINLQQAISNNL